MGKIKENIDEAVVYTACGFGVYYLLTWFFMFFPAFILALQITRWFFGIPPEWDDDAWCNYYILCIVLCIAFTLAIKALFYAEQYFVLLTAYLLTLWPLIYMVYHYCIADGEEFPLPIDWCFLW